MCSFQVQSHSSRTMQNKVKSELVDIIHNLYMLTYLYVHTYVAIYTYCKKFGAKNSALAN